MDRSELEITAELALVNLDQDQLKAFEASVGELLDHFALMDTFDVSGLAPTTHALTEATRHRPDVPGTDPDLPDLILQQASDLEDRFITIPNVL